MVNPFSDQRVFMEACDQTTNGIKNEEQYALYRDLIKEEVEEAKKTFAKYKWPTIDVTRKSVEETAASIIKIHEIYKNND